MVEPRKVSHIPVYQLFQLLLLVDLALLRELLKAILVHEQSLETRLEVEEVELGDGVHWVQYFGMARQDDSDWLEFLLFESQLR